MRRTRGIKHTYLDSQINDNPMRDDLPYPMIYDSDPGFARIKFTITAQETISDTGSPFDGMLQLTVTVSCPSCNHPELHGADDILVYDHPSPDNCLTADEAAEDLVGRVGWAYQGYYQDQSSGASPGDLTPCHFAIDGLCCPTG